MLQNPEIVAATWPAAQDTGEHPLALVYTAVIRGQRLVTLVGQPRALAIAVRGARGRRRRSKLGEWLGGEGATAQADGAGGGRRRLAIETRPWWSGPRR